MTGAGPTSRLPRSPAGAPGKLLINEAALEKLQALRDRLGKPLIVRSAYRSPEHNRAVGGATRSKHMEGAAGRAVGLPPLVNLPTSTQSVRLAETLPKPLQQTSCRAPKEWFAFRNPPKSQCL
jgi:hypothetical protein